MQDCNLIEIIVKNYTAPLELKTHSHASDKITYYISGSGTTRIGDTDYRFKKNTFVFHKADNPHSTTHGPSNVIWLHFTHNIKGVSFKVNPKETVALVGSTGSGKSTILSLIVRNYDIQKGQILIDGIDIKKIKISSLRKHFGQMLQDVFIFSGTIKSNIVLREESITDKDVKEACDYVNASHFINKLENGLDDEVLERGNNFSSGQRQLLSFARTIAHKPEVMILDEATANIDTETEKLIQDSLEKMMNVGTMLIVAHRLSTIQHADKIIVLSHGEILEQGNHQELLKLKRHYYNLYNIQLDKDKYSK